MDERARERQATMPPPAGQRTDDRVGPVGQLDERGGGLATAPRPGSP